MGNVTEGYYALLLGSSSGGCVNVNFRIEMSTERKRGRVGKTCCRGIYIYKKKNCARKQQTEVTFFSIPCGSFPNPLFQLLLSKWLGGLPLFTHSFLLSSISMWFPFAPDDTEEIVKFYFIFSSSFFILFDFASRVFRPVYVIRFLLYYKFSSFLSHDFLFYPEISKVMNGTGGGERCFSALFPHLSNAVKHVRKRTQPGKYPPTTWAYMTTTKFGVFLTMFPVSGGEGKKTTTWQ